MILLLLFCLFSVIAKGQELESTTKERLLQENMTINDDVELNKYRYYRIPYHYGHKNTTIQIIPSWGDPDLYLTINSDDTLPTKKNYDYMSSIAKTYEEKKELFPDAKSTANCPSLLTSTSANVSSPCYYHIGVYGYAAAAYTFIITTTPIMPIEVWPEWGTTISTKFGYDLNYFSIVNSTTPWTISLAKIAGKGSIYFTIHDYTKIGEDPANWPSHSYSNVSYQMITNGTNEEIYLGYQTLENSCPNETCVFMFCISCFSWDCSFNVTLHQLNRIYPEDIEEPHETDNNLFDWIGDHFSVLFEWPYIVPTLTTLFFIIVIILYLIFRRIHRIPHKEENGYQLLNEEPGRRQYHSNYFYSYGPPDANLPGDSYANLNYMPEYNRNSRTINLTRHYQEQGDRSLELYRTIAPLYKAK